MREKIVVGSLVLFETPTQWIGPGDPLTGNSENMKIGLVLDITTERGRWSSGGSVFVVHSDGETHLVPEALARPVRGREQ